MKRCATILLIFAILAFVMCSGKKLHKKSSGYVDSNYYNYYSYDERDFNKYKWSAWQRSQWVQNHNGWILNVKKCTYHNRWNGHTFAMWSFDPKCESFYTAYQITPEMCHGENPKKFLWERGFRNIVFYEPGALDVVNLNPNVVSFNREENAYIKTGTLIGPQKIALNTGRAFANAPEPLSPQQIMAKAFEEKQRAMEMVRENKMSYERTALTVKYNKLIRVLNAYLEATNQTLTPEETAYFAWLVGELNRSLKYRLDDKIIWLTDYEDGTVEYIQNYKTFEKLLKRFIQLHGIDAEKSENADHYSPHLAAFYKKYYEEMYEIERQEMLKKLAETKNKQNESR